MSISSSMMSTKYTHLELDKDVEIGIAGYYTPQKEVRLKYNGREVLYVIGQAVVESSCCGPGSWAYAIVPGYIINWQNMKNEAGLPVSEVESILDEEARENIRRIIQTNDAASLIGFW
ncbi:hypothetical protein ES703_57779 [subsurface metagenome]